MQNLGQRLSEVMKDKGYTQDKLADEIGVTQMAISRIISGKTEKPRNLLDIANALGVDPNWLQTGITLNQTVQQTGNNTTSSINNGNIYTTNNNPPAAEGSDIAFPAGASSAITNESFDGIKEQLIKIEKQLDALYREQVFIKEQISNQINKLLDRVLEK